MHLLKTTVLALLATVSLASTGIAQDARPVLKVGVEQLPEGLAPGLQLNNVGQRITYSIFDHLIKRGYWTNESGDGAELMPSIATEWRNISPTEWEVDIRQGVTFHDGKPLTAEDVAFTFGEQNMWGKDRIVVQGTTYFGNLTDVSVVDADTVKFTTVAPDPIFAKRFTAPLGMVVPKDYYLEKGIDGFNLAPIGTGPYKVAEYRQHEILRLVAHDDYWGGTPPAKEVQFIEIPEEAARISALINGELDVITNVSPDQQATLSGQPGIVVKPAIIDNTRTLAFNTFAPPMDDVKLRRAIALGADRKRVAEALWGTEGRLPHPLNLPGHGEYYFADRPAIGYDPEEAKRLLSESKYNGEELVLRVLEGYYTNYLQAAQILQEMWRDIGINVKIEVRDSGATLREGTYHLMNASDGMQVNDPLHPFYTTFGPTAPRTAENSKNREWAPPARFWELGELLSTTTDVEERKKLFREALDIFDAEVPEVPLFQAVDYYAMRETVDWKPYSFFPMDFGPNNLSFKTGH